MPTEFRIIRIEGGLPVGFDALCDAASAEGVRNMTMLREAWASGSERFNGGGAALFGAWAGDVLIGVGGTTPETRLETPAMRMRRFYVLPAYRGGGAGRGLAKAAIRHGFAVADTLTVNAQASASAGPFWEAMGFETTTLDEVTHIRRA
ncbi:MAG: GNAT family N-acetyltransferase [Pseudomonadota bacterium]